MHLPSIKKLFCLAAVIIAAAVQASTLPLSQLPDIGTNQITSQDFVPADNYQGANPVTVRIPISKLQSNFVTAVTSNLNVTLNPVISSNPPVQINDLLVSTNQLLSSGAIGGVISGAACASNAVVMIMGDSYTDGTGTESSGQGVGMSTAWSLGSLLRQAYGDDGVSGSAGGYGYGWNNDAAQNQYNYGIWPVTGPAVLTQVANSNTVRTAQNNAYLHLPMPTNFVNLAGVCYITQPFGGSNNVTIWSPNANYTNTFGIITTGSATNFVRTNIPVPLASDYSIFVTNIYGTNILFCPILLSTNPGVQYVQFGFAGKNLDQYFGTWSNLWQQIFAAFNPDVFVYNNIHWPYSYDSGGNTAMAWSNQMAALNVMLPAKTKICMVGQPPNVSQDMKVLNYQYKLLCQAQGWSYVDLWGQFPSFTNSYNLGLFETGAGFGIHPSLAGMQARAAAIFRQWNAGNIFPKAVDLRNINGTLPLSSLPSAVVTNGNQRVTLNDLIIGHGSANGCTFNVACAFNPWDNGTIGFFGSGGVGFYGSGGILLNGRDITAGNNLYSLSVWTGALTVTNAAALGSVSTATATAGSVTVTNTATAQTMVATNLCLAGQFGAITQFYVSANSSNSITVPAGKTYFVTWNGARSLNTLIWTNGYGVGSPVTLTNLAWPVQGPLILKAGWVLSLYDTQGYPAGGLYYPL